jgi:predicted transcriptional regulator
LDEIAEAVAQAIRERAKGRSHMQLAIELGIKRRTVCHIVRGERKIGGQTLLQIILADPPWLREVLAGIPTPLRGSNGKGPKGRPT